MGRDQLTDVQRDLLATPQWEWLTTYLATWCANPLHARDGSSPVEIEGVTTRTGLPVPEPLAQWWSLVGRRLQSVQDVPATPNNVQVTDGRLDFWTENQGVWIVGVQPDASATCVINDTDFPWPQGVTVAQAAQAMLVSETIAAGWVGHGQGPLGALAAGVSGGMAQDVTQDEVDGAEAAFAPLDIVPNPLVSSPVRGDERLLVRGDEFNGSGLEWVAADEEARQRFAAVVDLDPPGGGHAVTVNLAGLGPAEVTRFFTDDRPDMTSLQGLVADTGRVETAQGSPAQEGLEIHVRSTDPEALVDRILTQIPTRVSDRMTVTSHPARLTVARSVYPEPPAQE